MDNHKLSFSWDIIYKCNFRCSYCWWDNKWVSLSGKNQLPSFDECVRSWTRIYESYGEAHIEVLGGEPFLSPNFIELVREISGMHTVNISTNLSCGIDRVIKEWDPARVTIRPTFHPMFAELNEFRGKVLALFSAGFTRGVTYLAYPPQIAQSAFYKDIFVRDNLEFSMLPFWGTHDSRKYPDGYSQEEKRIVSPELARRNDEEFQLLKVEPVKGKLCYAGCRYACIHPDGETFRCGGGSYGGLQNSMGNFFKEGFRLLDGPEPCPSEVCPCNEWAFLLKDKSEPQGQENTERKTIRQAQKQAAPAPFYFSWEICYTCNYRCPYCGRWNDASPDDLLLSPAEWEKIWGNIYEKYGPCNLFISGAEPSTYPDFFDIVQRISRQHSITVCTNFSWDARQVLGRGLDPNRVKVTPTFHSLFADFDTFLGKAVKLKPWIRDDMVFFVAYPQQMKNAQYYKKLMNESGINFNIVPLRGSDGEGLKVISSREDKEKIGLMTDMSKSEFEYLSNNISPEGKPCNAGYRYAVIRPNGKVSACGQSKISLGQVHNGSMALLKQPSVCSFKFCPYESYNLIERSPA